MKKQMKQPTFNPENDWVRLPRWKKRLRGFMSYTVMAFWSLRHPELVDWVLYNDLKDEFEQSNHGQFERRIYG